MAEVLEYPFDLAKVRLQAQLLAPSSSTAIRFEGPMHCLAQTWKEEGVRGLYRVSGLKCWSLCSKLTNFDFGYRVCQFPLLEP